jgi:hypothetical protein
VSIRILRDTLDTCLLRKGLSVGVGHAVAVLFDADSEQRILRAADAVQEGVGLREMGAMPHISLAVFRSAVDVEALASCVKTLARNTAQFELRLSAIGAFPRRARPVPGTQVMIRTTTDLGLATFRTRSSPADRTTITTTTTRTFLGSTSTTRTSS